PGVVAGVLLTRGRVRLAPDGVERLRDVHRRAARGPLEEQVLEEVGRAVVPVPLVARADADPRPDRRGAHARHVLGEHADAAGQDGTAHEGAAVLLGGQLRARLTRADEREGQGHQDSDAPAAASAAGAAASPFSSPFSSMTACSESLPRGSISAISTWTFWPTESTSSTFSTRLPPTRRRICEMCRMPSLPGVSETNAPNVVVLTTVLAYRSPTSS